MTDGMFGKWTLVVVGAVAALLGMLVMGCCDLMKNRLVKQAMRGRSMKVPRSVGNLWEEVGLGMVLTIGVLFFSMICFAQEVASRIALPVAYCATLLCGVGCFLRAREGMNALGLTRDEEANPEPVAVFPEERTFLFILAVFSVAVAVFLAGLLTLGWELWCIKSNV